MRGLPKPSLSIVRGLQGENPFVPVWIMDETDVFDLEVSLSLFPLFRPSRVRFVEELPQFGDFNRIGRRKENFVSHRLTHHHAISFSRTTRSRGLAVAVLESPDAMRALHSNNRMSPSPIQPSGTTLRRKIIPLWLKFSID
jgi:hypothetical protein